MINPLSRETDPGIRAAARLMKELDPEPQHALQVYATSMGLFDVLKDIHALGDPERRILAAAALVHDTGFSVGISRHHKHSRDIVLHASLEGFSPDERRMIACLARYHRCAHPAPSHKVYRSLRRQDQDVVNRLAAILRIGDGLDRCHDATVDKVRAERKGRSLRIYVRQHRPSPGDLQGAARKQGLFEEVFGLRLEILPDEH